MKKRPQAFTAILSGLGLYRTHAEYNHWIESLELRPHEEWQRQWEGSSVPESFFVSLAAILSLPNHHLLPADKLSLLLFNCFADLSDVEALLFIEDELGIQIEWDKALAKMSLSDLLALAR